VFPFLFYESIRNLCGKRLYYDPDSLETSPLNCTLHSWLFFQSPPDEGCCLPLVALPFEQPCRGIDFHSLFSAGSGVCAGGCSLNSAQTNPAGWSSFAEVPVFFPRCSSLPFLRGGFGRPKKILRVAGTVPALFCFSLDLFAFSPFPSRRVVSRR